MKPVLVKSLRGSYEILIGEALLEKIGMRAAALGLRGKVMIVTQEAVAKRFLKKVADSFRSRNIETHTHLLTAGETAKSEAELFRLYHTLCRREFERRDMILALGGGVVGDLSGFAAATYLRGLAFVNAPTTLLAQVDSAIGGKTGINLPEGKNLVGAFYPPRLVISDTAALQTLPGRQLRASLAEVVKYAVIRNAQLFRFLEKNAEKIIGKDPASLDKIVRASAQIKAGTVSRDEYETRGERMILNFGHTFGHGLEQALHYTKLLHGEAVSVGMVCAARLAVRLKLLPPPAAERITAVLKKFQLPISAAGLDVDLESVLAAMSRDKKRKAGRLRFVLPTALGKVVVREDISLALVREILYEQGVH